MSDHELERETETPVTETEDRDLSEETPAETEDRDLSEETSAEAEDAEPVRPAPFTPASLTDKPYHERYYLLYGSDAVPEALDLSGTLDFLRTVGYDGGEMMRARHGRVVSDVLEKSNKDSRETHFWCAYCGTEIVGTDYYRLQDGRKRCTRCTRSLVRSAEDLQTIFGRVVANMELFFGTALTVKVDVAMMEERKLKRKLRVSLEVQRDPNALILGVAVRHKKEYSIYLENGAPRISVISTVVHELTHIWQYTHWEEADIRSRYGRRNSLAIYEGMAKWSEIQYLYLIGETAAAAREEERTRTREDAYGVGFNLYCAQYPLSKTAMTAFSTPFNAGDTPLY